MILFIDTNFFLQCMKYDQVNWSEITSDNDITILITRPVQIEIDRLKNDGNLRRAKRARETTSFFRKILAEDNMSFLVETSNRNITFKFAKQYSDEVLSKTNPSFDMSSNDDKILATLYNYISEGLIKDETFAFLSNDTNPILTAKLMSLPVIQIPNAWLLAPENDNRDKEILKLKQQVSEYQKKEPIIGVEFDTNDYITLSELHNEFNVNVERYNQVAQSDIEKLIDSLVKKHPKKANFDTDEDKLVRKANIFASSMYTYCPPNDNEIMEYNKAYQDWQNDIYELFINYADVQNKYAHIIPYKITIKNDGNISAENLILDFEILTGGQLVDPDFDDKVLTMRLAYPTPPKPPDGKWKDKMAAFYPQFKLNNLIVPPTILRNIIVPNIRDKNSFYWKNEKPKKNATLWRFECDEFRHKLGNKNFSYYFIFNENSEKIVLQVRVSASNMSSLLENIYILHKKDILIETKNSILHLIKYGVTEEVMKKIEDKEIEK